MRKIVIAARRETEPKEVLIQLLEALFPECEVQVVPPEASRENGTALGKAADRLS